MARKKGLTAFHKQNQMNASEFDSLTAAANLYQIKNTALS
jgi:hypothetical protein